MTTDQQVQILKATKAIALLNDTITTKVLLAPESLPEINESIRALKYKLSIIEEQLTK